jgi:hypothetical protein
MPDASEGGWLKSDGTVIAPEDMTAAVIGFYGSVMLQVQAFEFGLAFLVALVERTASTEPKPVEFDKQMRALVEKWQEITQRLTAGQARNRLRGKVSDELIEYVKPLIDWRNFLAHRYLRIRMGQDGKGTPAMAVELINLGLQYRAAVQRLNDENQERVRALPKTEAPQGLPRRARRCDGANCGAGAKAPASDRRGKLMARPATGQVVVRERRTGRMFALRFRAYGDRQYVTLGTDAEGWTQQRAEVELQNVLADVRRGVWRPPHPEPAPPPVADPKRATGGQARDGARAPGRHPRSPSAARVAAAVLETQTEIARQLASLDEAGGWTAAGCGSVPPRTDPAQPL